MKTNRLTTGFISLTDANFETKAESIFNSMNGNPNFPSPVPAMGTVEDAVQAYSTALTAAQSRDKNDVAVKNQKRGELTVLLIQLASSVMAVANGDKTMLISSGFDLAKEGETTPLQKPENIQVVEGINPGELIVSVRAVKGARSYVHQYTQDPVTAESQWVQSYTTTSKYTFKNLDASKKYWCRVAAVGAFDQLVISDSISRIVQ
jgi:hypothetical protein